jgi:hypothetical protein
MTDSGMGPSILNKFLCNLNIPTLSNSTIKRHELIIGEALEAEANASMRKAVWNEKHLTW